MMLAAPSHGAASATKASQRGPSGWFHRRREAWLRSVAEYFPKDELWVARSRRDLAQLYLTEKRYAEALVLLDELAAMSDQNF